MTHGEKARPATLAAGLAIAAAVVGVMACGTWGAERARPRGGRGRAVRRDKGSRQAKEDPKAQGRQAGPGGIFDTPERTGVYFATGVKVPVELKWKFRVIGTVATAPVVRGGRVYVGGTGGVYCLKLATGEEIWRSEYTLAYGLTVANGVVYASVQGFKADQGASGRLRHPGSFYLVALDASSGKELWKIAEAPSRYSPPVAAGDVVYFGSGSAWCVDAKTGRKLWQSQRSHFNPFGRRVVYTRDRVYASVSCFSALDARNGKEIWSRRRANVAGHSPVVDGRIFVAPFGPTPRDPPSWLEALDARTGRTLWKFRPKGSITMDPVAWDGNVFFGDQASNDPKEPLAGNFYVLDAATGKLKWQFHSPEGWFVQSPAVADGVVYLQGRDGVLRAFDVSDGSVLWQFQRRGWKGPDVARYDMGAPAVADGLVLVVAADGRLYALGPAETEPSPGDLPEGQPEPSSPQGPARPAPGTGRR